jgi:hypothetical protein
MKALKSVIAACLLSAAVAHAQTPSPADNGAQQVAQANTAQAAQYKSQRPVAKAPKAADECVGPASYCTIYFGS